jgi:hypothetical protein
MGVCWQTTGDNSSRIKSSSRLTNSIIVAAQPNSTGTNIHHQELNEQKNNNEKKMENAPIFDSSFEESVKNYPDMPEIEPKIMKGYGIKQMPGYKCDLKIDQLNKKRDEFWVSKNKLNIYKWKIIHQACIYDHINAEEFLYKNNIKTVHGCINMCLDENGKVYRVPNYCINDPTFQLELLNNENSKKENINIVINDVSSQVRKNYNVFDTITGKELIDMYCDDENINKSKYKFKLIFGGAIIKDDETLFQHKVKNDYVIQICKTPI